MKRLCPKCGSEDVKEYEDLGFIKCFTCGYDELNPEPLPYDVKKTGGSQRTRK